MSALGADGQFRGYVGAPRVFIGAFGRDTHDPNAIFNEIDLALDDVMLVSSEPAEPGAVARRQLWYGALETALETQLGLRRAAALDPAGLVTLGPSIGDAATQRLLTPADIAGAAGGPAALMDALDDGLWVVAPKDVSSAGSWWTIDPTTGTTRSVLDPGLGGLRSVSSAVDVDGHAHHGHRQSWQRAGRTPWRRPSAGQLPGRKVRRRGREHGHYLQRLDARLRLLSGSGGDRARRDLDRREGHLLDGLVNCHQARDLDGAGTVAANLIGDLDLGTARTSRKEPS